MKMTCLDQRIKSELPLDRKKVLLGSHENCDLRVEDKSVSSYHAFICLKSEGLMIKDLYSEGGVYVNGRRVEEAFVNPGDVITLGTISFALENEMDEVPVFNPDESIAPVMASEAVELPSRPGLVFIDGEYCDIEFDESSFVPLMSKPEMAFKGEYVELDQTAEALNVIQSVKAKKLEVMTYVNGLILDVSYISLKEGDFSLPFLTLGQVKIMSFHNGQIQIHGHDQVTPSVPWSQITLEEATFFTHGTEQISVRLVTETVKWKGLPLFFRDRDFFKESGRVFASVIVPFLVLLFVTVPKQEEPAPEVAVVYKLPSEMPKVTEATEKSEVKAQELTSQTENTGHKETQQPPEKVEFAQASQHKKIVAKATAPAATKATPVQTVPVKAYEFKGSSAFNSLVGDAPKVNTEGPSAKGAATNTDFRSGTSGHGELVAGADIGVSKFNGSDKKGSGSASFGSRGLASKSGFDSSYLEPKTVVMGSMDPELLRKILREYIPQFRHCYQQELIAHSEKVKGVIDLNFTISPAGKVAKYDIKVKDARFSTKGVGCMGQVLSLIDFPKPKGGGVVDVRQPLNFFAETEKI